MTPSGRRAATGAELHVLGVRVHMVDEGEALDRIEWMHEHGPPRFVSYVNPHTVNIAVRDPTFGSILSGAGLRLADGFGIRIAARRQGSRVPAILNGTDFNRAVLRRAAARGWRVFLLGGRPGVADRAADEFGRGIPGLRVVGTHDGYFSRTDEHAVIDRIRASGTSVLMVGLGQPRQERWLERHLAATGARVGIAVGGFLDFGAGTVPRAPGWMNRAGLEWTFRLAHEPRRLAGRYILGTPAFLWRVARAGAWDSARPERVVLAPRTRAGHVR